MRLFRKKQTDEKPLSINISEKGIWINGTEVTMPATFGNLHEIFGEPTRQYYEDNRWRIIWDNYGVSTDYVSWKHIPVLTFLVKKETRIKHLPKNTFKGTILINDKPIEDIPEYSLKVGRNQINKGRYQGKGDVFIYSIMKNYDYKEENLCEKYVLPKPTGNAIEFKDFNFKLAVIDELMYNQELIKPKFDMYEYIENCIDRKINMKEEGYEPIPEAIRYFTELEIDKDLAAKVTEIYQDGGNDIYANIIPYWDGEDDLFDIKSCEDVQHLPNLKKMTLFSTDPKIYEELKSMGIEAKPV